MAGIKVTTSPSGNFILMEFNDYALYFEKAKIRISEIRSVCKARDKDDNIIGVQVVFASHNSEMFQYSWFDEINGDTDLDTHEKLWAAFDKIIDPPPA